ncbi:MAG TPA: hypothetical protein VMM76_24645 [Pirellulaceae bacterium]|nr:hypothetical protein [Pirellulaceae bacterium]
MGLILNGFRVDCRIEELMRRNDWAGRRTNVAWFERFRPHPKSSGMPFVQLCSIEQAKVENREIRVNRFLKLFGVGRRVGLIFNGKPSVDYPPGDFDPCRGYLIGFTDYCDSAICVDLRPSRARIIYENVGPNEPIYATAFDTIDEFLDFFVNHNAIEERMAK